MNLKCKLLLTSLLLFPGAVFAQHESQTVSRTRTLVKQLSSTDTTARTSAETELKKSPSPEALPILLNAAEVSSGELRAVFVRILAVYNDTRKIPVLLKVRKSSLSDDLNVGDQLALLGDPASTALMNSFPEPCDDSDTVAGTYVSWVGHVIGDMNRTNPEPMSPLIAGLRSGNPCKQRAATEALQTCCAEPGTGLGDPHITLFTDAVSSEDEAIRSASKQWISSFKGDYTKLEFGGICEVLIAVYQSNAPPATMVKIARLLAEDPSPRVTRFMRAAIHAPNPKIQDIAREYLATNSSSRPR